ncbi:hypothetical protein GDO81_027108 [Engystomops pustulosus]|uniref:Uncharacterized protein n=1 Tax=Engystomops pustulosus TaxID=76066 RepID=A0AAV6YEX9_ENGPU|nr:hypothetical protein GDO81_027108 [Engystomops pustulosus]
MAAHSWHLLNTQLADCPPRRTLAQSCEPLYVLLNNLGDSLKTTNPRDHSGGSTSMRRQARDRLLVCVWNGVALGMSSLQQLH